MLQLVTTEKRMAAVLTYEKVKEFCDRSQKEGKNPTARAIVSQKNIATSGLRQVSQFLQDAILAEIGQCVNNQTLKLTEQIEQLEETRRQLAEELEQCEHNRSLAEEKCGQLQQEKSHQEVVFDKELAVRGQIEKDLKEDNALLRSNLDNCRTESVRLGRSEAALTANIEGLKSYIEELKNDLKQERQKNLELSMKLARHEV
jgi:chromosome segregation ATPase